MKPPTHLELDGIVILVKELFVVVCYKIARYERTSSVYLVRSKAGKRASQLTMASGSGYRFTQTLTSYYNDLVNSYGQVKADRELGRIAKGVARRGFPYRIEAGI